jgi:hypothetical protein
LLGREHRACADQGSVTGILNHASDTFVRTGAVERDFENPKAVLEQGLSHRHGFFRLDAAQYGNQR